MNQVILEGEIVSSRKGEYIIKFEVKVEGGTFYCEVYGDMCKYVELKHGEKVHVVGRLATRKFDGGNVCFVIAEYIEFM